MYTHMSLCYLAGRDARIRPRRPLNPHNRKGRLTRHTIPYPTPNDNAPRAPIKIPTPPFHHTLLVIP